MERGYNVTVSQACKLLHISSDATFFQKQQAYITIQKRLSAKLMPGNSLEERKKAQAELKKLSEVWNILQLSAKQPPYKARQHKITHQTPATNRSPQTVTDAWEQIVQLLPFPEPVIAVMFIVMFLLIVIGLIANL